MLQYRKELDGLRALAVIAVLFYHVNLVSYPLFEHTFFTRQNLFRGGFLGVDVFFVLSGFLITAMIKSAMDNQTFSFRDFYIRRAKRIIPVFLIVLGVATVGAYLLLFPAELNAFAAVSQIGALILFQFLFLWRYGLHVGFQYLQTIIAYLESGG